MPQLSVLIPVGDDGAGLAAQVPRVLRTLQRMALRYELILVSDGPQGARAAAQLQAGSPDVRVVYVEPPCGLSAALSEGIVAARGEFVVAIEAGGQYDPEEMAWLLKRLARADLVCGRRQRSRGMKWWQAVLQFPRRLLLGAQVRDPDCLFWAARREALVGLDLARGMHRYLGSLVALRGYRTTEIHVSHDRRAAGGGFAELPSPGNLLCVWWLKRKSRPRAAVERAEDRPAMLPAPSHDKGRGSRRDAFRRAG